MSQSMKSISTNEVEFVDMVVRLPSIYARADGTMYSPVKPKPAPTKIEGAIVAVVPDSV